jgi:hypothetical protein
MSSSTAPLGPPPPASRTLPLQSSPGDSASGWAHSQRRLRRRRWPMVVGGAAQVLSGGGEADAAADHVRRHRARKHLAQRRDERADSPAACVRAPVGSMAATGRRRFSVGAQKLTRRRCSWCVTALTVRCARCLERAMRASRIWSALQPLTSERCARRSSGNRIATTALPSPPNRRDAAARG